MRFVRVRNVVRRWWVGLMRGFARTDVGRLLGVRPAPLSQVERNRRWREKNCEHYNRYMREYRLRKKGESG